ncbi:CHAP domain-containing protein [Bradyrhizobium diazoefficiens]|uniref:CHAP domain-containing protein n=1 Tax=Bradyrhizobium diazoefficiens TaxID=1355477 RepID=UPI00190B65D5|nr:CHAP domain-containing protein [Bradyrhizobium diazoefficiens]MBK3660376.1 CHAP domain-containing protein [Bradyrhizobium diazoefficiens]
MRKGLALAVAAISFVSGFVSDGQAGSTVANSTTSAPKTAVVPQVQKVISASPGAKTAPQHIQSNVPTSQAPIAHSNGANQSARQQLYQSVAPSAAPAAPRFIANSNGTVTVTRPDGSQNFMSPQQAAYQYGYQIPNANQPSNIGSTTAPNISVGTSTAATSPTGPTPPQQNIQPPVSISPTVSPTAAQPRLGSSGIANTTAAIMPNQTRGIVPTANAIVAGPAAPTIQVPQRPTRITVTPANSGMINSQQSKAQSVAQIAANEQKTAIRGCSTSAGVVCMTPNLATTPQNNNNCVSFVRNDLGTKLPPGLVTLADKQNAINVHLSEMPKVGDVAVIPVSNPEDAPYGHVAKVTNVSVNSITIVEANYHHDPITGQGIVDSRVSTAATLQQAEQQLNIVGFIRPSSQ